MTAQIGNCQNFITEWSFSEATSEINFRAHTDGDVNYTWSTTPSGNSGSGTFNNPFGDVVLTDLSIGDGDVVILEMEPDNLQRFYIANTDNRLDLTDVTQWGLVSWTGMSQAFQGCENLEISATDIPDLSNVSHMTRMFDSASSFNTDIGNWDVSAVTHMDWMFSNAESFNQDIGDWDVSNVFDMERMFQGALLFDQDISGWDVSNVTTMTRLFARAESFNQPVGSWDVSGVTSISGIFREAIAFNQDISSWDVSNVTSIRDMFNGAVSFNQNIGGWDVSNVVNMEYVFANTEAFNQDIGGWDVSDAGFMRYMFYNAGAFNQDIGAWDVSSVQDMVNMFGRTDVFNQDIGGWVVATVTTMGSMFSNADAFNQDISDWDVLNVENMVWMFRDAESFNQNLGEWILNSGVDMESFLSFSGMDCDHYSATLAGFLTNNPDVTDVNFGAQDVEYGTEAIPYRDSLVNQQNWTISGDVMIGNNCDFLLSSSSLRSSGDPQMLLFPNPATDKIYISGNTDELNQVRIFNSIGSDFTSTIKFSQTAHGEVELDVSGLANGVYLIRTATQTRKLIKY